MMDFLFEHYTTAMVAGLQDLPPFYCTRDMGMELLEEIHATPHGMWAFIHATPEQLAETPGLIGHFFGIPLVRFP